MIILRQKNYSSKLNWHSYSKNPITLSKVSEIERKYSWKYPKKLKEDILEVGFGRPENTVFYYDKNIKLPGHPECIVVKTLLSLNEEDMETIYPYIKYLNSEETKKNYKGYIPFMNTPGGDLLMISPDKSVVYYDHELDKCTKIAPSYENFRDRLTKN